ncbi:transglycosylase, Slt family protein [Oceanicola granulosus HTCC2516]|uniref:Transglycosylase, Slt family protein n=1 Tax=Oceanicola granulosus (strain ATCC BAA-861 / DSM 15982 / KCTC 12143 / HTCC2516) TaxID=314256 RepID=Q2CDI4_OCEGH|nr:transglycosylase SLT domain-containing protein [Oceanicola granulosus]EAR50727.1 transglycosylase, Slt family protein [Oceanicola granulosus HTCC2516]
MTTHSAILSLLLVLLFPAAGARADPADLCLTAARTAAAETNVPLSVLVAISLTETGRRRGGETRPWPWTVNMEGAGHWFDDAQEALSYTERQFDAGKRSFDVGCFQINYRWHGQHFPSISAMFDPVANARYAARFLVDLHEEFGDWSRAAGAYHSRTPRYAERYRVRFDRFRTAALARGVDAEAPVVVARPLPEQGLVPRENRFPLLQAGGRPLGNGSLVPMSGG